MQQEMTQELKDKWIVALRSGQFKQCNKQLKSGDAYCCLGVLCVVADIPITPSGLGCDVFGGTDGLYRPLYTLLDPKVNFHLAENTTTGTLIHLNDIKGMDFNHIADWAEDNVKVVDVMEAERV